MSSLSQAENRVTLAELNLRNVTTDYERMQRLKAEKVVSDEEFEATELKYKQAREELKSAKDALNITREGVSLSNAQMSTTLIRSTIDGLILDIPVKVGNSVILSNSFNDGTTIATVANMSDLIFRGNVDETEVGQIKEGMPLKISIGALPKVSLQATLEYISPKAVANNGANQFEIKAAIQVPAGTHLRSGYSANGEILLQEARNVLTIPEASFSSTTTSPTSTSSPTAPHSTRPSAARTSRPASPTDSTSRSRAA
jgi:HlyD family secretion protein